MCRYSSRRRLLAFVACEQGGRAHSVRVTPCSPCSPCSPCTPCSQPATKCTHCSPTAAPYNALPHRSAPLLRAARWRCGCPSPDDSTRPGAETPSGRCQRAPCPAWGACHPPAGRQPGGLLHVRSLPALNCCHAQWDFAAPASASPRTSRCLCPNSYVGFRASAGRAAGEHTVVGRWHLCRLQIPQLAALRTLPARQSSNKGCNELEAALGLVLCA
jgi:hypothetical protein